MGKIKCICFDIDGVLFDRDRAEIECLKQINNQLFHDDFSNFQRRWKSVNNSLWTDWENGKYKADEVVKLRWKIICEIYQLENSINYQTLSENYVEVYTNNKFKTELASYTNYYAQRYTLGIITNGVRFVQYKKLSNLNILKYFKNITTPTEAGCRKPNLGIFKYFIDQIHFSANEIVYIGDSDNDDIVPARKSGFVALKYTTNKNIKSNKNVFSCAKEIAEYIENIDS